MSTKNALIVVDVQIDFISESLALDKCPSGENGQEVIPVLNNILLKNQIKNYFIVIVYTQDWHPLDHCSFIENKNTLNYADKAFDPKNVKLFDTVELVYKPNKKTFKQTLWPKHCVHNTHGANLAPDLIVIPDSDNCKVYNVKKGMDQIESYSAFFSVERYEKTQLDSLLKQNGITDVFIGGLATDVCVYHTAVDSVYLGYKTHLIIDACRGSDKVKSQNAMKDLQNLGVKLISSNQIFEL